MKKISFLLSFLMICGLSMNAQRGERPMQAERAEKIEAMKIAFITKELNLSVDEAKVFWPIYNAYEADQEALKKDYRKYKKIDTMTDQEVDIAIAKIFEYEQKKLDLKIDYFNQFKKVISPRKTAKLQKAERAFKAKILKEIQRRKGENRGPRGGQKR